MSCDKSEQQGFALISVLLVVALVTIIATQLIYQQSLTIQRSSNMLHQAQASSVAWGLESWIKKGLQLDAEQNKTDHLAEQWALPMYPIPFEGGEISGQLFDLQARINVNNLQEVNKAKRKRWQEVMQRFLIKQELDANLHEVMTDWVDTDNESTLNGAESDYYLLERTAYRAANQKLVLVQELGLLKGFSAEIVGKIKPYLATLPAITTININTADEVVLQSLADWVTREIALSWIEMRKETPAEEIAGFWSFMASQSPGMTLAEVKVDFPAYLIDVKSQYFLLVGLISYGEAQQTLLGIFMRDKSKKVRLIQRWVGITDE